MTYPFNHPESAIARLKRADDKLTETLHWVVYDSEGRSEHTAPPNFAKRESKKDSRKNLLFWIAVGFLLLVSIWGVVR